MWRLPWNWHWIWRCRVFWLSHSFGEAFGYTVKSTLAPLGRHQRKRLRDVQGIRLVQVPLKLKAAQKLFERSPLAGFVGVVGLLSQGDTERPGIDRDLSDKPVTAVIGLHR